MNQWNCLNLFNVQRAFCGHLHIMRNNILPMMNALQRAGSVGGQFMIAVKYTKVKYCFLLWSNNNPSLSPSPLFFFFIGCSLCQHVFCFQGIKAHGSATLSSRRQLSECLCSDITWLDVTVSCSGLPYCNVVDGRTGGLFTEAWLIYTAPQAD